MGASFRPFYMVGVEVTDEREPSCKKTKYNEDTGKPYEITVQGDWYNVLPDGSRIDIAEEDYDFGVDCGDFSACFHDAGEGCDESYFGIILAEPDECKVSEISAEQEAKAIDALKDFLKESSGYEGEIKRYLIFNVTC